MNGPSYQEARRAFDKLHPLIKLYIGHLVSCQECQRYALRMVLEAAGSPHQALSRFDPSSRD